MGHLAATDEQAQQKLAAYLHAASPEAGLAHFAAGTGIDFSRHGLDEPIAPPGQGNAQQSAVSLVTGGPAPKTRRQLLADRQKLLLQLARFMLRIGKGEEPERHRQR